MPASRKKPAAETVHLSAAHSRQPGAGDGAASEEPVVEVIRVSSPGALLAAVPILLGFVPSEPSVVVAGTTGPRSAVRVAARYDIPGPGGAVALAGHVAGLLSAAGISDAYAVGYGPASVVDPVVAAVRERFAGSGIAVHEALRARGGRYWSYLCTDAGCCPPEGVPFDLAAHPLTVRYAGEIPILASREALAATVAPVAGEAAQPARRAARVAARRARRLVAGARGQAGDDVARSRVLRGPGLAAVGAALGRYRAGGRFECPDEAAWLALLLRELPVRDDAWARMDPAFARDHLRLWTDLTTVAAPSCLAAPASLLAFVAWQSGEGALANVALDRALDADPRYSMALLLRQALDAGAPPEMARLPMTPEEVAASYDAREQAEDADHAPAHAG
jgi:hypothetical protein